MKNKFKLAAMTIGLAAAMVAYKLVYDKRERDKPKEPPKDSRR